METYISLLRGINVSGQKKIRMADLKALYVSLGLTNVRTYIQSGNVVFRSASGKADELAAALEAAIRQEYGYAVTVLLRDAAAFAKIVAGNPFFTEPRADPARLYVTFLPHPPPDGLRQNLRIPHDPEEAFVIRGKEVYLFCPNGYGRTKLSNQVFERKLKMSATTRNWKTVLALHRIATGE